MVLLGGIPWRRLVVTFEMGSECETEGDWGQAWKWNGRNSAGVLALRWGF